jgi:hypothetical protein
LAVYDWDGDGLDEAVNLHPDLFYVVDGTGVNLVDRPVYNGGTFPGGSPLYGTPIVADFRNNGTDTVLFAGSYSQLGLVTRTGAPVWHTSFTFDATPGFIQGVGDADGDGDLDLFSVAHPSAPNVEIPAQLRVLDAATGAHVWTINLPGRGHAPVGGAYSDTPTLSVSADLTGDGKVDSVFAINGTIYVVGTNSAGTGGEIKWSFTPDGGLLGSPIIADANGDGVAEIIVTSTSGYVYGIGAPAGMASFASAASEKAETSVATSVETLDDRARRGQVRSRHGVQATPSAPTNDLLLLDLNWQVAFEERVDASNDNGRLLSSVASDSRDSRWHAVIDELMGDIGDLSLLRERLL